MLFPGPVLAALHGAPDRIAIESGSRAISRGELLGMVRRLAGGLRDAGLSRGKSVGMALSLTPEAYAAHLAAHALGCTVAAARPGWSAAQREEAMRDLDMVLTDTTAAELLSYPDPGGPLLELGRPDDIARLVYTSGSTGKPKACAHTYRAMSLAYQPEEWAPPLKRLMTQFERCLIHHSLASPVHFTYLGRCLVAGGTAVMCEEAVLAPAYAIERYRITATAMPPAKLDQVLRSDADLSSLRAVILGGSPASPHQLRNATERLGPIVWQGYGQGEAGIIAMLTPEDIVAGYESSVGRPMPAVELSIRDGEVCVRSPHMMAGYWNDPVQTGEVLRDGWLYTRDLGHLDDDGMLYLNGRSRDVIMVNAEVCYAGAIERVLTMHPDVAQAYVVGGPDPVTGEAIHAFVVPAGEREPDAESMIGLIREHLSGNNTPKSIDIIHEVPVSANGKPDKGALLL